MMTNHPSTPSELFGRHLLSGFVYSAIFIVFALVALRHHGFPLDDSWIYAVIARNLVRTHHLGFIAGQTTSGATSFLWTLILAAGDALLPEVSPQIFVAGLSAVILGGIGTLLSKLTKQDAVAGPAGWCLVLAPLMSGNFLWFGLIGMEHLLFLLLSVWTIVAWTAPRDVRGRWDLPGLAVLLFLLGLTRPEGIFLVVLLAASRRRFERGWKDWAATLLGSGCAAALQAAMNWKISGTLTSQTMRGRQLVLQPMSGIGHLMLLPLTYVRILRTWLIFDPSKMSWTSRGVVLAVGVGFAAMFALAVHSLIRKRHAGWLLLSTWAVAIEGLYIVVLPNPGHGGRYISLPLTVCFCLLGYGFALVAGGVGLRGAVLAGVLLAAGMASALESGIVWSRVEEACVEQINGEHGVMAEWMQAHLPAEVFRRQQVAVYDIGRIGYQFDGDIVDLGGLVDYRFTPYLVRHDVSTYLQEHGVMYAVLPGQPGSGNGFSELLGLNAAHGVMLQPVHDVCVGEQTARFAYEAVGTALPCQKLYELKYLAR